MLNTITTFVKNISFDDITLFFLGIFSIRQLIAQNMDIPLPKKMRWLIYDKKDSTPPVLCRRAYNLNQLTPENCSNHSIIDKLLELGGHHIKYYQDGLAHGRSSGTQVQSKYFINTLEASYNEKDLSTMTTAIRHLIANSELPSKQIDFILCLKSGNHILARNIYKDVDNDMIYICRLDGHSSNYPMKPNAEAHLYSVQFENLDTLLDTAKNARTGKLNGIAIDCSVSTGIGLKEGIKQFNMIIDRDNLNINKIEHAFVLYAHQPFDDDSCHEFKLHRYYDMNEGIRELIYNVSKGINNYQYKDVYKELKDSNLIRNKS